MSWDESPYYKNDPNAFIYSVDLNQKFKLNNSATNLLMNGSYGPFFGNNDMFLAQAMNTFNNSMKQGGDYLLPNPKLITGSQNTQF